LAGGEHWISMAKTPPRHVTFTIRIVEACMEWWPWCRIKTSCTNNVHDFSGKLVVFLSLHWLPQCIVSYFSQVHCSFTLKVQSYTFFTFSYQPTQIIKLPYDFTGSFFTLSPHHYKLYNSYILYTAGINLEYLLTSCTSLLASPILCACLWLSKLMAPRYSLY